MLRAVDCHKINSHDLIITESSENFLSFLPKHGLKTIKNYNNYDGHKYNLKTTNRGDNLIPICMNETK